MKEPIVVEFTAREALALLSVCLGARIDNWDSRPEVATAEDKISRAIAGATDEPKKD